MIDTMKKLRFSSIRVIINTYTNTSAIHIHFIHIIIEQGAEKCNFSKIFENKILL